MGSRKVDCKCNEIVLSHYRRKMICAVLCFVVNESLSPTIFGPNTRARAHTPTHGTSDFRTSSVHDHFGILGVQLRYTERTLYVPFRYIHFGTFSNTGVNNDFNRRYIFKYYITVLCSLPIPDLHNAPNNSSSCWPPQT